MSKIMFYKLFTTYCLLFVLVLHSGCDQKENNPQEQPLLNQETTAIIIDSNDCNPSGDQDMRIEKALIEQNQLKLVIRYGGGCGTIENKLITCGYFMESNPVQLAIFLSHQDNDPCEALLKKELEFDLSPLISLYQENYQETEGAILLRLEGFDEMLRFEF